MSRKTWDELGSRNFRTYLNSEKPSRHGDCRKPYKGQDYRTNATISLTELAYELHRRPEIINRQHTLTLRQSHGRIDTPANVVAEAGADEPGSQGKLPHG